MNHGDPSLQPQRTALAWSRTGLSVLINALLVLRAASSSHQRVLYVLGCILLLASVVLAVCGASRSAALNAAVMPARPHRLLLAGITLTVLIAAVAGLLCMLAV